MKRKYVCFLALLLAIGIFVSAVAEKSGEATTPIGDDDLIVSGSLNEYSGTWEQEGANGAGTTLELNSDGTGTMTVDGKSKNIFWKVDEEPDTATVTVYDSEKNVAHVYTTTGASGLYDSATGKVLVRPEPDNLEIIKYDKAKKATGADFCGTWELTGVIVSMKDPPLVIPMSADDAYQILSVVVGGSISGPLRIEFNIGPEVLALQFGQVVDFVLPQLAHYFSGDALYVRGKDSEYTMVFFYVGNQTLHMMVSPNPIEDSGSCIFIFTVCEDYFLKMKLKDE